MQQACLKKKKKKSQTCRGRNSNTLGIIQITPVQQFEQMIEKRKDHDDHWQKPITSDLLWT